MRRMHRMVAWKGHVMGRRHVVSRRRGMVRHFIVLCVWIGWLPLEWLPVVIDGLSDWNIILLVAAHFCFSVFLEILIISFLHNSLKNDYNLSSNLSLYPFPPQFDFRACPSSNIEFNCLSSIII